MNEEGVAVARILLIDDQEAIRRLLRAYLVGLGHEVSEAANGPDGLALYRARQADLVITDIAMPEMNGLDLILELTRCFLNVKVIAMSGEKGSTDKLQVAKLLGARQTLQKPFSMEQLLSTVQYELRH
jgi:CheY-like chemotaxis protein